MLIVQNDPRVTAGRLGAFLQERGVSCRTALPHAGEPLPRPEECRAIVVLGGYMGVRDTGKHPFLTPLMAFMRQAAEGGIPLLGICLGGQLLAAALGAEVRAKSRGERGINLVDLSPEGREDPLFSGLPTLFQVFQWHNDSFDLPAGAVHLASSPVCPGQAFRFRRAYGLQFHPEVDEAIVASWVRDCGADPVHLADFTAARETFGREASLLFGNFLRLAGILPPHR